MEVMVAEGEVGSDVNTAAVADGKLDVATDPIVNAELDRAIADADSVDVIAAIVAPASFNEADKAAFAAAPPEVQKWWTETETRRSQQVSAVTQKASERERAAETAQQRAAVEAQTRYAQQLQAFVSRYEPQAPNPNEYQDMSEYQRAQAKFQYDLQGYRQLMAQVNEVGAQANQGARTLDEQHRANEQRQLHAAFPEWFDPDKGPEHVKRLTAIGAELGYSPELMAQAGASDVLALRTASAWKDKAEKYDRLMSDRMATVRAGKGPPPPNARGTSPVGTAGGATSVAASMYPNDVRR